MRTAVYVSLGVVLGIVLGLVLAVSAGVLVVDLIIPWEDVCAIVGPSQQLLAAGSGLLTDLNAWLDAAQEFLTVSAPEVDTESRSGLSGLAARAAQVAGTAAATTINVVTAPLKLLIELAQALLSAVQATMDAARDALAAIDLARC